MKLTAILMSLVLMVSPFLILAYYHDIPILKIFMLLYYITVPMAAIIGLINWKNIDRIKRKTDISQRWFTYLDDARLLILDIKQYVQHINKITQIVGIKESVEFENRWKILDHKIKAFQNNIIFVDIDCHNAFTDFRCAMSNLIGSSTNIIRKLDKYGVHTDVKYVSDNILKAERYFDIVYDKVLESSLEK